MQVFHNLELLLYILERKANQEFGILRANGYYAPQLTLRNNTLRYSYALLTHTGNYRFSAKIDYSYYYH